MHRISGLQVALPVVGKLSGASLAAVSVELAVHMGDVREVVEPVFQELTVLLTGQIIVVRFEEVIVINQQISVLRNSATTYARMRKPRLKQYYPESSTGPLYSDFTFPSSLDLHCQYS